MTTVYLQSTHTEVFIGPTGHHHKRAAGEDLSLPMAIDCDACAPYLVKDMYGTYKIEQVPLTEAQVAEKERIEREGNYAVQEAAKLIAGRAATIVSERPRRTRKRVVSG